MDVVTLLIPFKATNLRYVFMYVNNAPASW